MVQKRRTFDPKFKAQVALKVLKERQALNDQLPLHLGEAGHDIEKELARGSAGVDGIGHSPFSSFLGLLRGV